MNEPQNPLPPIDFHNMPKTNEQRILLALENIEKLLREYIEKQANPLMVVPADHMQLLHAKPGEIIPAKKRR